MFLINFVLAYGSCLLKYLTDIIVSILIFKSIFHFHYLDIGKVFAIQTCDSYCCQSSLSGKHKI